MARASFTKFLPSLTTSLRVWRSPDAQQSSKLGILLQHAPSLPADVMARFELAWPTDALYDENNAVQGYLMPKVPLEDCKELVGYCIPAARRMLEESLGTQFGKYELLTIARNLGEIFGILHNAGYVIGDVNHTNFLVRPDGEAVHDRHRFCAGYRSGHRRGLPLHRRERRFHTS